MLVENKTNCKEKLSKGKNWSRNSLMYNKTCKNEKLKSSVSSNCSVSMKLAVSPSKLAPLLHILVPTSQYYHIITSYWKLLNYHYKNEASLDTTPRRRVHLLDINVSLAHESFSFSSAVWKLKHRLRGNITRLLYREDMHTQTFTQKGDRGDKK